MTDSNHLLKIKLVAGNNWQKKINQRTYIICMTKM